MIIKTNWEVQGWLFLYFEPPKKLFIKTIKRWSKSLWALCKACFLRFWKIFLCFFVTFLYWQMWRYALALMTHDDQICQKATKYVKTPKKNDPCTSQIGCSIFFIHIFLAKIKHGWHLYFRLRAKPFWNGMQVQPQKTTTYGYYIRKTNNFTLVLSLAQY